MTVRHLIAIKAQIDAFPALPATVGRVMAVTADPESDANDLIRAVLPDQSMCTAILKVANSAFFGVPWEIGTIERAVIVLGYEEIRNIVLGKAVFAAFPKMKSGNRRAAVHLFWEHAFSCGLAAKIIGEHLGLSPSELFIAGLVHDIGKLAMFLTFPHEYPILQEIARPDNYGSAAREEQRVFAIGHDRVGMQLAEKWQLPPELTATIGYHHAPQEAPFPRCYPLIIQVADILALMYGSADILRTEDVVKIFHDFFPETARLWEANHLPWDPASLGIWFKRLEQERKRDESILTFFANS